ncbi:MAG: hypothetical protein LIP12_06140 [Clostridiales bacterium]|nr:hypothetical protein [Clostridiales bacterium]
MIYDYYYFRQLTPTEKTLYLALYNGVIKLQKEIQVPGISADSDTIDRVYHAITHDCPHLYYFNQSALNLRISKVETIFLPQYFCSPEQVTLYNARLEAAVNRLVRDLRLEYAPESVKVRRVHDYFCENVVYDREALCTENVNRLVAAHSVTGVFARKRAVCEGIAKAVKLLLNAAGMKCIVVSGRSTNETNIPPEGRGCPHPQSEIGDIPRPTIGDWGHTTPHNQRLGTYHAPQSKIGGKTRRGAKPGEGQNLAREGRADQPEKAADIENGEPHAWNIVKINGTTFHLDVTWDITTSNKERNEIQYDYYNLSDARIRRDHGHFTGVPACRTAAEDYFVQSHLDFYSKRELCAHILQGVDAGRQAFYFRYNGREPIDQIVSDMADFLQQEVFRRRYGSIRVMSSMNRTQGTGRISYEVVSGK